MRIRGMQSNKEDKPSFPFHSFPAVPLRITMRQFIVIGFQKNIFVFQSPVHCHFNIVGGLTIPKLFVLFIAAATTLT